MIHKLFFYLPSAFRDNLLFQYQKFLNQYQSTYFCQNDLDFKLMKHIKKRNGRYLEIGAFDGLVGSVSLRLERNLNWKGVLIEPLRDKYEKLLSFRGKKNICIHSACTENDSPKKINMTNLGRMTHIIDIKIITHI